MTISAAISPDGQHVVFSSLASNLLKGDTNNAPDVFLKTLATDGITRLTDPVLLALDPAVTLPGVFGVAYGNSPYFVARVNIDLGGAFDAGVALVPGGGALNLAGIFVRNSFHAFDRPGPGVFSTEAGVFVGDVNVHVDVNGNPVMGFISGVDRAAISGTNNFTNLVVYASNGTNLTTTPVLTANSTTHVYLRTETSALTNVVMVSSKAGTAGNGNSTHPAISRDGRFVTFVSAATNLDPADSNASLDLYVYEVATRQLSLIRLSDINNQPTSLGADGAMAPKMSYDGRFVVFRSSNPALVPGDSNGKADIFVLDRSSSLVKRVSVASNGKEANGDSSEATITDDGSAVAFMSDASNLVVGDNNGVRDVFVHDFTGLFNDPRVLGMSAENPTTLFGDGEQPRSRIGLPEYEVNTATLNLALSGTLFDMSTRGPGIGLHLVYNADPLIPRGIFGNSWSLGHESCLELSFDGTHVLLRRGAGQILTFTSAVNLRDTGLTYPVELTPPPGIHDQVLFYEDHTIYRRKNNRYDFRYEGPSNNAGIRRLVSVTDRNGNAVTLNVNLTNGVIDRITGPAGRLIQFTYVGGLCTQITTPDSRSIAFTYDVNGNLTQIRSLDNRYSAFYQYDAEGYLTQMNNAGRTTTFTYASRGSGAGKYVTQVNDAASGITRYELTGQDPVRVRRTSRDGKQTVFKANTDGQTDQIQDPLNNIRNIGYTANLPTSFTDANGKIQRLEHDARGNVTRQIDALNKETVLTYDANDNLLSRKNALNQTWNYTYDANHNLTRVRSPLGFETVFTYNGFGQVTAIRDGNNRTTSYAYDSRGNVTAITDPLGNTSTFTYDGAGLLCTRMTDARGNIKHLTHDSLNRLTQIGYGSASPGGVLIKNIFDALDQKEFIDELGEKTRVERNGHGLIIRTIPPLGNATRYEYNADNLRTGIVDPLNRRASTLYDDAGRPTRNTDRRGFHVDHLYDNEGNRTRLRDQRSNDMLFTYDDNNRLLTTRDPLGRTVSHSRDALGRINRTTNARGQTIDFIYDADGRLVRKNYNGSIFATYTYDAVGNLTQMTDSTGTKTHTYDAANRVTAIQYPDGLQATFGYDGVGNQTTVTYPGALTINYSYDNFNRMEIPAGFRNGVATEIFPSREKPNRVTSVTWGTNSISFQYDAAARLTRKTRSNGTITDYSYDANGRMTSVTHQHGTTDILRLVYPYDSANSSLGELITPEITPVLPPTSLSATYDAANQIVTWGNDTYAYDADGNLTSAGGQRFSASYDAENRLTSVTNNALVATNSYNGNGERIRNATGSRTRVFHHDSSGRLLFETDGGSSPTIYYIHAGGRVMACGTPASGYRFYHFNKTGHTMALTDSSGTVLTRYAYQPFGATTVVGTNLYNPFRFVGAFGVMDESDGMLFMRKRYYDANTGKFLNQDPIGVDGGMNLYAYADNSPFDLIDSSGTSPISAVWGYIKQQYEDKAVNNPIGKAIYYVARGYESTFGPESGYAAKANEAINDLRTKAQIKALNADEDHVIVKDGRRVQASDADKAAEKAAYLKLERKFSSGLTRYQTAGVSDAIEFGVDAAKDVGQELVNRAKGAIADSAKGKGSGN